MGNGFQVKCLDCGGGASVIKLTAEVKRTKGFFARKSFFVRFTCSNCSNTTAVSIKRLPKDLLK